MPDMFCAPHRCNRSGGKFAYLFVGYALDDSCHSFCCISGCATSLRVIRISCRTQLETYPADFGIICRTYL